VSIPEHFTITNPGISGFNEDNLGIKHGFRIHVNAV